MPMQEAGGEPDAVRALQRHAAAANFPKQERAQEVDRRVA